MVGAYAISLEKSNAMFDISMIHKGLTAQRLSFPVFHDEDHEGCEVLAMVTAVFVR
jgi:hypothetical protein